MNKRRLAQRRERLRNLAIQDHAHRCVFCRRELPASYLIFSTVERGNLNFCGLACLADWQALCAMKASQGQ